MKTGEIIKLGKHRLACGNCHDKELVDKLIGEDKIREILTDPPYGVNYDTENTIGERTKHSKIKNDKLQSDEEYYEFSKDWLEIIKENLSDYNSFYIFNSDLKVCPLRKAIVESGYYYSQTIIWIKNHGVLGHKDYLPQHEFIIYGWYGRHKFERSKSKSVLFYPKPNKSKLHPTMKPVGLLRKLILNSTKVNDIIYDPFGGSGSTMIACENTARRCLMMEVDEAYCDIIIKRWEDLIKKGTKKC